MSWPAWPPSLLDTRQSRPSEAGGAVGAGNGDLGRRTRSACSATIPAFLGGGAVGAGNGDLGRRTRSPCSATSRPAWLGVPSALAPGPSRRQVFSFRDNPGRLRLAVQWSTGYPSRRARSPRAATIPAGLGWRCGRRWHRDPSRRARSPRSATIPAGLGWQCGLRWHRDPGCRTRSPQPQPTPKAGMRVPVSACPLSAVESRAVRVGRWFRR